MIGRRIRSSLRLAGLILVIGAGVWALRALAVQFRIHLANDWQRHAPLARVQAPGKSARIIVFAPHSDDETLGCGGLIALARRNGARVRVVLLTNGDGFRFAVGAKYRTLRVTPDLCIKFALDRQRETLRALAILGVSAHSVTFLGYPDRGIADLWDTCWSRDRLYVSHATKWDHSPYRNSFTPDAPYCGESLLADLEAVIEQERPTDVYVPHPCDNHPDHYATYCFVKAALAQLGSRKIGWARHVRTQCYLVHRGDWPCPKGDYPRDQMAPPFALARAGTLWHSTELGPEVAETKRRAIACYRTQTAVERRFLMSFARRNEVFGRLPERDVQAIRPNKIGIDGKTSDWAHIAPAALDPVGDYVVANLNQGGDVRAIYLACDGKSLFVRMDCARNLSRRIVYTLNFRGLNSGETNNWYTVIVQPQLKCTPGATLWAYRGNVLELAIPLSKLNFDRDIFVQVKTRLMRLTVDNTGWHGFGIADCRLGDARCSW